MENRDFNQLELFSKTGEVADQKSNLSQKRYFSNRLWIREKNILTIIAFVLVGVICFSIGVERGKKIHSASKIVAQDIVSLKIPPQVPSKALSQINTLANQITEETKKYPIQNTSVNVQKDQSSNNKLFTIQLASYKTRESAQKEANSLRKRGLSPILFTKGEYIVLCVGRFLTKDEAHNSLSEFKKRYVGCYVRRI